MKKTILFSVLAILSLSQANLFAADQKDACKIDVKKCVIKGVRGVLSTAVGAPIAFYLCMTIQSDLRRDGVKKNELVHGIFGAVASVGAGLVAYGINDLKDVGVDIYKVVKNRKAKAQAEEVETQV